MKETKHMKYFRRMSFLRKILTPLIVFLRSTRLIIILIPLMDKILSKKLIKRDLSSYINYVKFSKIFKNAFSNNKNSNQEVLFVLFQEANFVFNLFNLLIAKFLELKGIHPIFLVCNKTVEVCSKQRKGKNIETIKTLCKECFQHYDFIKEKTNIDLIYMNDFYLANEQLKKEVVFEKSKIFHISTLEECFSYSLDNGYELGRFSRKGVLRYLYRAKFIHDAIELEIYKKYLLSGIKFYYLMNHFLDQNPKINKVIVHNGTLPLEVHLFDIVNRRKQIDIVTYETFLGDNSIIYKKNDEVMKLNWEPEMIKYYTKHPFTQKEKQIAIDFLEGLEKGKDMYAILNESHNSKYSNLNNYVCLFTNLNIDTAVIDRNTIFNSMDEWIYEVIEFWIQNIKETNLVIRIHPAELKLSIPFTDFVGERIKKDLPNNIILIDSSEEANSYRLIEGMNFGLVYSSTIGLEIAGRNKQCLVAGDPPYRNKDFVISPQTKDEYFSVLTDMINKKIEIKPQSQELYKFIYYNYFIRNIRLNNIRFRYKGNIGIEKEGQYQEFFKNNLAFFEEFYNEVYSN